MRVDIFLEVYIYWRILGVSHRVEVIKITNVSENHAAS